MTRPLPLPHRNLLLVTLPPPRLEFPISLPGAKHLPLFPLRPRSLSLSPLRHKPPPSLPSSIYNYVFSIQAPSPLSSTSPAHITPHQSAMSNQDAQRAQGPPMVAPDLVPASQPTAQVASTPVYQPNLTWTLSQNALLFNIALRKAEQNLAHVKLRDAAEPRLPTIQLTIS